jgi:hypothetical protein
MLAILGALFMVGTAISFYLSTRACGKADLFASPQQGALWAFIPAVVYAATGSKFIMVLATWIPTFLMVYMTPQTICKEKPTA